MEGGTHNIGFSINPARLVESQKKEKLYKKSKTSKREAKSQKPTTNVMARCFFFLFRFDINECVGGGEERDFPRERKFTI